MMLSVLALAVPIPAVPNLHSAKVNKYDFSIHLLSNVSATPVVLADIKDDTASSKDAELEQANDADGVKWRHYMKKQWDEEAKVAKERKEKEDAPKIRAALEKEYKAESKLAQHGRKLMQGKQKYQSNMDACLVQLAKAKDSGWASQATHTTFTRCKELAGPKDKDELALKNKVWTWDTDVEAVWLQKDRIAAEQGRKLKHVKHSELEPKQLCKLQLAKCRDADAAKNYDCHWEFVECSGP